MNPFDFFRDFSAGEVSDMAVMVALGATCVVALIYAAVKGVRT